MGEIRNGTDWINVLDELPKKHNTYLCVVEYNLKDECDCDTCLLEMWFDPHIGWFSTLLETKDILLTVSYWKKCPDYPE